MNTPDHPSRRSDEFDAAARRAGEALRRPAPHHGLDALRGARTRQQVMRTAMAGGVACLALGVGAIALTSRDDGATVVPATDPTTVSSTPDSAAPDTSAPDGTGSPPTTDPDATDPVVTPGLPIGVDTEMVWGGPFLLGVLVDGEFVPYSETSGIPAVMIDREVELQDRAGATAQWTLTVDPCGQPSIRPAPGSPLADLEHNLGLSWSLDYRFPGTLDGAADGDLTELTAQLVAEYGAAEGFDLFTPTESLDADPELETIIRKYVSPTDATDPYSQTWLAVWDPTTKEITTLAGDAVATEMRFATGGDGITDVNGDGIWEDLIFQPSGDVRLVQLFDGTVLARAGECRS